MNTYKYIIIAYFIQKILFQQKTLTREWSNKWFRSCDRNPDFFRDLILMEVSELSGLARFIVSSVCKHF
jgi:hypothetical protein